MEHLMSKSREIIMYTYIFIVLLFFDESTWPEGVCQQGGKRQSPINIQISSVIKDYDRRFIKYGPLKLVGYDNVLVTGVNTGQTVQFITDGDRTMHPSVTGGPLKHTYHLEELHFHWSSEHSINGFKYPMEIQFVHVRADLRTTEALKQQDGLAIISVFCKLSGASDEIPDEESEELIQYISQLMQQGAKISGIILNLKKLLSSTKHYYTYLGSLTSPECNEVVVWIIYEKPITITDLNYRRFAHGGRHNFRRIQKMRHHVVYDPPDPFIATPIAVSVVLQAVSLVEEFFTNVTRVMEKGLKYELKNL